MGNTPSQYPATTRPVVRVPAQPRPAEPTQLLPGYKQRLAPRPPQRVPSYKNPHCLVLPRDAPSGILKSRNGPSLPAEDYFSDEHDAESELDSPDEEFESSSTVTKNSSQSYGGRPRSKSGPYDQYIEKPLTFGNYTPNGEIIPVVKDRRSKSLPFDDSVNGLGYGNVRNGLQKLPNGNYQRKIQKGPTGGRVDNDDGKFSNGFSGPGYNGSPRELSERNNRVTFAHNTSQQAPALGAVVKPLPRRQKGRAPPPPRPPPPNAEPPSAAPVPPAVIPMNDPPRKSTQRLTQARPSLHDQLQEDIIKAAVARQSRDPVQPPKIVKPKTGEEEFRDQLIEVCKRIETYPGDETDGGMTTGRDSEWESSYDQSDYKPKTTSKFLVKPSTNMTRAQQQQRQQQRSDSPASQSSQKAKPNPTPTKSSEVPKTSRGRSASAGSVLGGAINIIPTNAESQDDWTPDQVLQEDMDIHEDFGPTADSKRNPDTAIFGPGMRMNTQESSMGSVRMYRSKSTDQGRPDKPSRFSGRHRNSDSGVRSKGSIQSFKDSLRSAFSSIGTNNADSRKDRKSVKGYFDQTGYRYGPDVQPVMYYHPQDPAYYQNYYPMPYRPPQAMSPTMPYGPWYEDPYNMYPPRPVPVQPNMYPPRPVPGQPNMYPPRPVPGQPILITDGMHRRAVSMDEMDQLGAHPFAGAVYVDPRDKRGRSKRRDDSKPRSASQSREYSGSWSSLKDDIQYDQGSISRSWRRLRGRGRGRSKSRESVEEWDGGDRRGDDSSDDEQVAMPLAQESSRQEASRRYQEAMQRGSRRRSHGKKNGGVSSSSDENKPPTKLLIREEAGLPPTGQKYRSRYRKKSNGDINL